MKSPRRASVLFAAVAGLLLGSMVSAMSSAALAAPPQRAADAGADGAAPNDAGADAEADTESAAGDAGTIDAATIAELRSELAALRAIAEGKSPGDAWTITRLFPDLDLLDDAAVAKRVAILHALSIREVDGGARAADAGTIDGGRGATALLTHHEHGDAGAGAGLDAAVAEEDPTVALHELEAAITDARLAVLTKPLADRRAIVEADAARAKQAAERERSEAEHALADENARRADEAREKALAEAATARNMDERSLANQRARAEEVRAELLRGREALTTARAEAEKDGAAADARSDALVLEAHDATPKSADADRAYDRLVDELKVTRVELGKALDDYARLPAVPRFEADASEPAQADPNLLAERRAILATARELREDADRLEADRRALAADVLVATARRESEMNSARLVLLEELSPAKRDAVLGLGQEGREQLVREIVRVELTARFYEFDLGERAATLRSKLRDPGFVADMTTRLVVMVIVLLFASSLRRRGARLLERARALLTRAVRSRVAVRALQRGSAVLSALVRDLVPFAALLLLDSVVAGITPLPELLVAWHLLLWIFGYRLFMTAALGGIRWFATAGHPGASLQEATVAKTRSSLALAGRFVLTVGVILEIADALLGRGYLYHVVYEVAWLGAIPIFILLIRRWRGDIADAYLVRRPTGTLADLVTSTRARWYGFFVAVAAFAVITVLAAGRAFRRFVLGFEQSRKALAYLFRRRLERRIEPTAAEARARDLPDDLLAHFSEAPVGAEGFRLDRFPGIARFDEALTTWRRGGAGSLLVVGETGFGKTSWLREAAQRAGDLPVVHVRLARRIVDPQEAILALGAALGAPSDRTTPEALADFLAGGARRLVVVDDIHRFFLRGVGTSGAWRALDEIVERTQRDVFWLAAIAHFPEQYLAWKTHGARSFRAVVRIDRWSEGDIQKLLDSRMRASGYEAVYDDLVVDRLEGVEREAQLLSTSNDYARLIWDYSDGCPRAALRCWIDSLVPEGDKRVRVRLFARPDIEALEALVEEERFVLAALIWHQSLDAGDAVLSLRYARSTCEAALARLEDLGVVERDAVGFRLTTRWSRGAIRFARRKHLIAG